MYDTPGALQKKIDQYYIDGVKIREVIVGKGAIQQLVKISVPTITGLCYYLGFQSRQAFYDYEKKEKFTYTIKKARLFIEQTYEEQLTIGNTTGAIFALKNMGWSDNPKVQDAPANWTQTTTIFGMVPNAI